jgi:RNA polymerase sigma-70 factor (ECF subfamily)
MVRTQQPGGDTPPFADQRDPPTGAEHHEVFNAFFRDRYRAVVKAVMYAGATLHDAEDATSYAMTEAYLRWPLLENPAAWVRMVAVHDYVNSAQRSRRRPLLETEAARMAFVDNILPEPRAEPDERHEVIAMLRELPTAQRKVMALAIDGFEPAKIAEMLQMPAATVRSNLRHARDRLRREINDVNDKQSSRREREGGV